MLQYEGNNARERITQLFPLQQISILASFYNIYYLKSNFPAPTPNVPKSIMENSFFQNLSQLRNKWQPTVSHKKFKLSGLKLLATNMKIFLDEFIVSD